MIIEPRKSAEDIDRRLSALTDPELSEMLKDLNQGLLGHDLDSYTSPYAPYWKRRIGLLALAGLFAMSVGFGAVAFQPQSHPHAQAKPKMHHAVIAAARPHNVAARHKAAKRAPPPIVHYAAVIVPAIPDEASIRQARAQLLHERAIAAEAQARAAQAQHQAKLALQAKAAAQARAHAEAVAQAQAEAIAQQRTRALSQAQAQAQAQADEQARADTLAREAAEQDWVRAHTSGPGTKSVDVPPGDNGRLSTGPSPRMPIPMPGPVDPNCTPHRGSLFTSLVTSAVLSHVKVGGTNLNTYVQLRP